MHPLLRQLSFFTDLLTSLQVSGLNNTGGQQVKGATVVGQKRPRRNTNNASDEGDEIDYDYNPEEDSSLKYQRDGVEGKFKESTFQILKVVSLLQKPIEEANFEINTYCLKLQSLK